MGDTAKQIAAGIPQHALLRFRGHFIVEECGKEVMLQSVRWLRRNYTMSIKQTLLANPDYSETKFKREYNVHQRPKIENSEPLESYDVTLLYKVLQRACGLAPPTDDCWFKTNENFTCLEYKIQRVKEYRNIFSHPDKEFTEEEVRSIVSDLKVLFADILSDIGNRMAVPEADVALKQNYITNTVNKVYDKIREPLDPNDLTHFNRLQDEMRSFQSQLKKELIKMANEETSELFLKLSEIEPAPWALHQKYVAYPTQVYVRVKVKEDEELSAKRSFVQSPEIPCDDMLRITKHSGDLPDVIILSGEGGRGKTSLIKYFLEQYSKGESCAVRSLNQFELLFHIEGRNNEISCFKDLVKLHMPSSYSQLSLTFEHLYDILLEIDKLILIDAFDEHNGISRKLVKELLSMPGKNRYIITTRPTTVEDVNMLIPTSRSRINLQLQGIPHNLHEEFVKKLLTTLMEHEHQIKNATKRVMTSLHRLRQTIGDQLNTPLTLALIVLLYYISPSVLENLTGSTELFERLRVMMTEKLIHKLVTSSEASEYTAKKKCNKFLDFFDLISFRSFCKKEFELKELTKDKLADKCDILGLPEEILLSTYLNTKRTLRGVGTAKVYTYQHLMMQEFGAARYLTRKLVQFLEDNEFEHESLTTKMNTLDYMMLDEGPSDSTDVAEGGETVKDSDLSVEKALECKFSGLSAEKVSSKGDDNIDFETKMKIIDENNIVWKVLTREMYSVGNWNSKLKEDFIKRAQNILMFMIGHLKAEYDEYLQILGEDIVALVYDEQTSSKQPYIDTLVRIVAESGNNERVTKVVAKEIKGHSKKGKCSVIQENHLSIFQHILSYTCPERIAFDIRSDPTKVPELMLTLSSISDQRTSFVLQCRSLYEEGTPGDCDQLLELICMFRTCKLEELWGKISNEGFEHLPSSLGVLCLRLDYTQITHLNNKIEKLPHLWSLATVVEVPLELDVTQLPSVRFPAGKRLVVVVCCPIADHNYSFGVSALKRVCPPRTSILRIIGFWGTRVSYLGAKRLLYALHAEGYTLEEFVVVRSTETLTEEQRDTLSDIAKQLCLTKTLVITDPV